MYYLAYNNTNLTIGKGERADVNDNGDNVTIFTNGTDLINIGAPLMARCLRALGFEPEDALPANVHDIVFELTEQAELPVTSVTEPPGQSEPTQYPAQGVAYNIDSTDAVIRISTGLDPLPGSRRFTAADATDLDAMGSDLMLRCFYALGQKLNVLPPMASDVMFELMEKTELPASMSVQDWPLAKSDKSLKKSKKDLTTPSDETIQLPPGSDVAPEEKETTMTKEEIKAKKEADKAKATEAKAAQKAKDDAAKLKAREKADAEKAKAKAAADKAKTKEDKVKQKAKDDAAKAKAKEERAAQKAKDDAAKVAKAAQPKGPRGEKTLAVKKLLERKSGCTRKDILEATGWPAVSVQAMAKTCGLKLRQEKEKGKVTTYFGS